MPTKNKIWKLLDILNLTTEHLKEKNFENPRLNAERLLSHALHMTRVDLYLNFERPITPQELTHFKTLLKRRLNHEPLQYIIGETEFMSLPFKVNKNVLIPRPETELLVEKVIEKCKSQFAEYDEISVLDIGTGSGNIAISLAKYLQNCKVVAIDVHEGALKLAKENVSLNGVTDRVSFIKANVMDENFSSQLGKKFDVIVSNPPYVSREEYEKLPAEIKNFEPVIALNEGSNGYSFFQRIIRVTEEILKEGGIIALEIGLGQRDEVVKLLRANRFSGIKYFEDLNKIPRVVMAEKLNE